MPHIEGHDPFKEGMPSWMYGAEEFRTPQDEWAGYTSTMPEFWSYRAPMEDFGQRARARYLLGAPAMGQAGYAPPFTQYLSDWPGRAGTTTDGVTTQGASYFADPNIQARSLRARATEAARAATMAPGAYIAEHDLGTPEWDRAAWYLSQFGADAGAQAQQQNQMAVANMLALQRPDVTAPGATEPTAPSAPTYRGRMAQAIRNAMARLYQQRVATGEPRENFLSWYLGQTG